MSFHIQKYIQSFDSIFSIYIFKGNFRLSNIKKILLFHKSEFHTESVPIFITNLIDIIMRDIKHNIVTWNHVYYSKV